MKFLRGKVAIPMICLSLLFSVLSLAVFGVCTVLWNSPRVEGVFTKYIVVKREGRPWNISEFRVDGPDGKLVQSSNQTLHKPYKAGDRKELILHKDGETFTAGDWGSVFAPAIVGTVLSTFFFSIGLVLYKVSKPLAI